MKCQHCHTREAVIHMAQKTPMGEGQMHLCEVCAKEIFSQGGPQGFEEALVGILSALPAIGQEQLQSLREGDKDPEKYCPHCRRSWSEVKRTGHLGCPKCYEVFAEELFPEARAPYPGHVPEATGEDIERKRQLGKLHRSLELAVERQDYAEASRIQEAIDEVIQGEIHE